MIKRRGPPSQGWRTFLRNHAPDIAAMDLFVVPTVGFDLLYAFVIVRLDRRDLVWINVTANPTAEWIARQITEAFPWDDAPQYLIRDRIESTAPSSHADCVPHGYPGQAYCTSLALAEWFCRTADRIDPARVYGSYPRLGEAHLRRILRAYAAYYNEIRTHRSLDKDAPLSHSRPVQRIEPLIHTRSSAAFITITSGFKFLVHTRG